MEVFAVYGQGVCLNAGNVFAMIQQQTVAAILVAAAVCELSYLAVLLRCELWEGAVNPFVVGRLHGASGGSWVMLVQPPLKAKGTMYNGLSYMVPYSLLKLDVVVGHLVKFC